MIALLYAVLILAQAAYWLVWRDETVRLSEVYFDACVYPVGRNVQR